MDAGFVVDFGLGAMSASLSESSTLIGFFFAAAALGAAFGAFLLPAGRPLGLGAGFANTSSSEPSSKAGVADAETVGLAVDALDEALEVVAFDAGRVYTRWLAKIQKTLTYFLHPSRQCPW